MTAGWGVASKSRINLAPQPQSLVAAAANVAQHSGSGSTLAQAATAAGGGAEALLHTRVQHEAPAPTQRVTNAPSWDAIAKSLFAGGVAGGL